jgi:eukaryotic-like serine/threonine-protein kinase
MQQLDQDAGIREKSERRTFYRRLCWLACGLLAGALAGGFAVWLSMRTATSPPLMRFVMSLPQTATLALRANPLLLSGDGRHLAYVAQLGDNTQLMLRELEDSEPRPVPGTLGAYSPFFSPDGSWIGYFDARDSKLKRVARTGGNPVTLCPAQFGLGASWGEDGTIIFAPDVFSGLWRIQVAGGKAEPVTQLQPKEFTHRWPQILPGGKVVIFTVGASGAADSASVAALTLKSGQKRVILEGASDARYSSTGHLFFVREGNLMAVRFDPNRLKVTGTPFLVKKGIGTDPSVWAGQYSLSHSGVLAYVLAADDDDLRSLAWADRQGGMQKLTVNRGAFSYPRLSPDGQRLAVVIKSQAEKSNIWTLELANSAFKRLTSDGHNLLPVWAPDGTKLTFASVLDGEWHLYRMPADGSGSAELLRKSASPCVPNAWSRDGRSLVFTEFSPDNGPDIWTLSVESGFQARPYLCSPYAEWGGTFSPDGHWLAYTSNDSGLAQVYVQPYPGPGERYQISTAEGREPVWGHDGRELFFRYWKGLMEVGIQTEGEFSADPPRVVIPGEHETGDLDSFPNYDVARDGQRFVLIPHEQKDRSQINIDLNWLK